MFLGHGFLKITGSVEHPKIGVKTKHSVCKKNRKMLQKKDFCRAGNHRLCGKELFRQRLLLRYIYRYLLFVAWYYVVFQTGKTDKLVFSWPVETLKTGDGFLTEKKVGSN